MSGQVYIRKSVQKSWDASSTASLASPQTELQTPAAYYWWAGKKPCTSPNTC